MIMERRIKSGLFLCFVYLVHAETARILLLPSQIGSHILDSQHLGVALAKRGHEVYTLLGSRVPESFERSEVNTIRFQMPDDVVVMVSDEFKDVLLDNILREDKWNIGTTASALCMRDCEYMLMDAGVMKRLKQMNFDLAIYDGFILAPCLPLITEVVGIPLRVNFAGAVLPWDFRIPALPSFVSFGPSDNVGLFDKFKTLFFFAMGMRLLSPSQNVTLLKKYAPKFHTYNDLLLKTDLNILARDHLMEEVGPSMPNVLYTGGLSPRPAEKLRPDLESFMQGSPEGVIVMSFGSQAGMLPANILEKFLKAFTGLPQNVIWRLTSVPDEVKTKIPPNVKVLDWLPQVDLLGHPKTKLFITHCGNNGQYEAVYHAVPMLGIPLFAEQYRNGLRAEKKGIGLTANLLKFTPEELRHKIEILLTDGKYAANVKRISDIMKDAPMSPVENAVYHIEHILKFGSSHLRSAAMDLPLYQFLMLDMLAIIFVVFFVITLSTCIVLKRTCRKIQRLTSNEKVKQN